MRKLAFLAATLVAALPAGSALAANHAAPFVGVVVGSQHGVLLVASPSGVVRTTAGHTAIGERISIAGNRIHLLGRVHRALVRGVVVRHRGNLTFLSAARQVIVVRSARNVASARDTAPAPGTMVQETVGIGENGELDEQNEQEVGAADQVEVQAVITAVAPGTVTITVNGQSLTIPLPAGLTLPASLVGTQVTLELSFANGQANAKPQENEDDDDSGIQPGTSTATITAGTAGATTVTGGSRSRDGGHDGDGGEHHGGGDD
jgi:hypothetical protein